MFKIVVDKVNKKANESNTTRHMETVKKNLRNAYSGVECTCKKRHCGVKLTCAVCYPGKAPDQTRGESYSGFSWPNKQTLPTQKKRELIFTLSCGPAAFAEANSFRKNFEGLEDI